MMRFMLFAAGVALFVSACATPPSLPQTPALFAPDAISLPDTNMFRGAFSPDGDAFYFFRKVTPNQEDYRIFVSHYRAGRWQPAERLELGGDYSDLYPTLSPDGTRMVFTSYRPTPGSDPNAKGNANLWYTDRTSAGWGPPVFMAQASTLPNYDAGPTFAPDGTLHFMTISPDWQTRTPSLTRWNGTAYGSPQPDTTFNRWRGQNWSEDYFVWGGTMGPAGRFALLYISDLVFNEAGRGRPGPARLWVTFPTATGWTAPRYLEAGVNTEEGAGFVTFSPDGKLMYFVRGFKQYYHIATEAAIGKP